MSRTKGKKYRIPSDKEVVKALDNVMLQWGIVESQQKLLALVKKDLSFKEPLYTVSPQRLRYLAISNDIATIEIHAKETDERVDYSECPVCLHNLDSVRNKTLDGGEVAIEKRCKKCGYWTGFKRRRPMKYTFVLNKKRSPFKSGKLM